jgi:cytidine deaminase
LVGLVIAVRKGALVPRSIVDELLQQALLRIADKDAQIADYKLGAAADRERDRIYGANLEQLLRGVDNANQALAAISQTTQQRQGG